MEINRKKLIKKYLNFFESKDHQIIPSSSLVPENDPTILFTTAGMQPLIPYLGGEIHPLGKRLTSVQKCVRTVDIEEVGDSIHHTFFEMLGNWSLGDYWKEESIKYSFEFLTGVLGIDKKRIAVSLFKGNSKIPKDKESAKIWESVGIKKERIVYLPEKENWWGPVGNTGPCGSDTEIFYYVGKEVPKKFDPQDKNWVEIWNNVFMILNKKKKGVYEILKQKNVDTGMGVERTVAVLNKLDDNYLTPSLRELVREVEKISGKSYKEKKKEMRIITDHVRTSVFILGEDKRISPSNTEHGYVLRRLIRRAIRYGRLLDIKNNFLEKIAKKVISIYSDYEELKRNKTFILEELEKEEKRFSKVLEKGLKVFDKISKDGMISGKEAFLLFQSYGFPIEMTEEIAKERGIKINLKDYEKELEKHQKLSRITSSGKFKSGLSDFSSKTKKLHTATHLLNESLRKVLDKKIRQKGSNINSERLRFDFNFPRKLKKEEIKEVENLVNEKINAGLKVEKEEKILKDALKSGAQSEFGAKYPSRVYVYTIIDPKDSRGWFSREICSGPHVENTKEIGQFKIIKEESSAAGIRRIKAKVF